MGRRQGLSRSKRGVLRLGGCYLGWEITLDSIEIQTKSYPLGGTILISLSLSDNSAMCIPF